MASVITADLHLSANPRDAYRHRWMEGLPALLQREEADRLIICGDLTTEKDYHSAWLTNKIVRYVHDASAVCPVYILMGNHDYTSAANPFFEFLGGFDRVHWIKEVTETKLKGLGRCLFIPHQRKLEAWDGLEQLKEEWNWVFAHATFQGARNEQDLEMEGPAMGLVLGHRVISGDVHVPQKVGPVTYVGPPFRINYGDTYQPRILLLSEHHANQRLCEGPRKVLVEAASWDDIEAVGDCRTGNMVKIRYSIPSQDYDKWPLLRKRIEDWAAKNKLILDAVIPVPLIADTAPDKKAKVVKTASDLEIIKSYATRYQVGDKTLRMGLRLLEKAK